MFLVKNNFYEKRGQTMGKFMVIRIPVADMNESRLKELITVTDEEGKPASQINLPQSMSLERVEPASLLWHKSSPGCVTFYIFGIPFTV
jgi:hypothetical protein